MSGAFLRGVRNVDGGHSGEGVAAIRRFGVYAYQRMNWSLAPRPELETSTGEGRTARPSSAGVESSGCLGTARTV